MVSGSGSPLAPRPVVITRPDGLTVDTHFLSETQQRELLAVVEALPFREVKFRGYAAKRETAHFGFTYAYDAGSIAPTDPVPEELLPLRARCAAVSGIDPERFEELLVSRYPEGSGIGWHRDAPMFGSIVAGVSLGAACTMKFRRERKEGGWDRYSVLLEPGSLYVLSGAARWIWQHGIDRIPGLRYSLTWREVRGKRIDD